MKMNNILNNKIKLQFIEWFVGFADGESNFSIIPKYDENKQLNRFSFRFTIGLHIDDISVLQRIKQELQIGTIQISQKECKYVISDKESVKILLTIFDLFNLNTTKYLDYLDFKQGFNIYINRKGNLTEELKSELLLLKNNMNNKRKEFNLNSKFWENHIRITDYWLLGLIEAEGSFNVWRADTLPTFALVLSENQYFVLLKMKEYLLENLGFDEYSLFKLSITSSISIDYQKGRNNSKPSYRILIKNILVLQNYVIPYLNNKEFLSKKYKDFVDWKLICLAVYKGLHMSKDINLLLLKLTYTLNNFRLSTCVDTNKQVITQEEKDIIKKEVINNSTLDYLWDGRTRNKLTNKIIHQNENSIYLIETPRVSPPRFAGGVETRRGSPPPAPRGDRNSYERKVINWKLKEMLWNNRSNFTNIK